MADRPAAPEPGAVRPVGGGPGGDCSGGLATCPCITELNTWVLTTRETSELRQQTQQNRRSLLGGCASCCYRCDQ